MVERMRSEMIEAVNRNECAVRFDVGIEGIAMRRQTHREMKTSIRPFAIMTVHWHRSPDERRHNRLQYRS